MFTYFFLALLLAVIVWRVVLPSMNLAYGKTPTTGALTTPTPPTMDWKVLFKKYHVWSIVLAVVGAGIFWKLYKPGLRFSQLGDWSWENWLWLLAFWGVLVVLIALNKKSLGSWAKTLQSAVAVAMFLMFLGVPAGLWVRDIFLPAVVCPDVSAHETRSCNINTSWSTWFKAAEGPAVDGMQVCSTPGGKSEREVMNGTAFFRYKADEGRLVKAYRLFPANQKCPATLP